MADLFENLSGLRNVDFLIGNSPEDLKTQLLAIRLPTRIIAMYAQGTKHVAWIQTSIPIKKKNKEKIGSN